MPVTTSDGCELWWESVGTGEHALLLIMGFGNSSNLWQPVVDRLSPHMRIVRFDNRGTGRSEAPRGAYTTEQMARDVIAVMDAAGVSCASLYGVSMGAVVAQATAIEYPDRVASLILGCATCPKHLQQPSRAGLLLLVLIPILPRRAAAALLARYTYGRVPSPELRAQVAALREVTPRATSWRQARGGGRETCSRLSAVRVPALVMHGANDRLVPPVNGKGIADKLGSARYVEIPEVGHLFFLEALERSTTEIMHHMSSLAAD